MEELSQVGVSGSHLQCKDCMGEHRTQGQRCIAHLEGVAMGREDVQDELRICGDVPNGRSGLQRCWRSKVLPLQRAVQGAEIGPSAEHL